MAAMAPNRDAQAAPERLPFAAKMLRTLLCLEARKGSKTPRYAP